MWQRLSFLLQNEYDDFAVAQRRAAITLMDIGRMYRNQGNAKKAEDLLKQALTLEPRNPDYQRLNQRIQLGS